MKQDVAVIGCSTAGLLAANELARKGLVVSVFESGDSLNGEDRSLIVTSKLEQLLLHFPQDVIINKIRGFEIFVDGNSAFIPLKDPELVLRRSKLIEYLAREARRNGAQVFLGRRFLNFRPNGRGLDLIVSSRTGEEREEISTRILIGADGAFSRVAKSAGWPAYKAVYLVQAVVGLPERVSSDLTRIWFIPEDTPYFYWLIPESEKSGVVGLIGEEKEKSRKLLENFLEKQRLEPAEFQEGWVPYYTGWVPIHRTIGEAHVFLVGDAACHVKVTTVGGVVYGFQGALGVAEAVLNGGESPRLKSLRRELKLHYLLRKILHRFNSDDYARLLTYLDAAAIDVLSRIPRDEAMRLMWHLFLKQPRLLLLGLRVLLK